MRNVATMTVLLLVTSTFAGCTGGDPGSDGFDGQDRADGQDGADGADGRWLADAWPSLSASVSASPLGKAPLTRLTWRSSLAEHRPAAGQPSARHRSASIAAIRITSSPPTVSAVA